MTAAIVEPINCASPTIIEHASVAETVVSAPASSDAWTGTNIESAGM
jgi:hypothetical protein